MSRMFVAVVPPAEVLAELETFLEPRLEADPDLRWTRPPQWHVTLAFLPSVAPRSRDRLEEALDDLATRSEPVDLTLRGGGAFPTVDQARVLWLGLDDPLDGLTPLARGARSAANAAGTKVEGGPFRAHLTLARLRLPGDVTRWLRILDEAPDPTWTADELVLVESHLGQGPRGTARHVEQARFPLG